MLAANSADHREVEILILDFMLFSMFGLWDVTVFGVVGQSSTHDCGQRSKMYLYRLDASTAAFMLPCRPDHHITQRRQCKPHRHPAIFYRALPQTASQPFLLNHNSLARLPDDILLGRRIFQRRDGSFFLPAPQQKLYLLQASASPSKPPGMNGGVVRQRGASRGGSRGQ